MARLLALLALVLAPAYSLAQSCESPPPMRGYPSQTAPLTFTGDGYQSGHLSVFSFGDVFLEALNGTTAMLWAENDCGLWVRTAAHSNDEGDFTVIKPSNSGTYIVSGAGQNGQDPFLTISHLDPDGSFGFSSEFVVQVMLDVPAYEPDPTDESSEADGVAEEMKMQQLERWRRNQR